MRKIVAGLFISLDGVVEAPDQWHFPYFNDEMGAAVGEAIGASDALLLGRRGYEEFAAYWPQQDPASSPFVSIMNDTPKFVASTTLENVDDWQNSTCSRATSPTPSTSSRRSPARTSECPEVRR